MIGQGVLRECLLAPDVNRVLTIGWTATGVRNAKPSGGVHADLWHYESIEEQLRGFDGCRLPLAVRPLVAASEAVPLAGVAAVWHHDFVGCRDCQQNFGIRIWTFGRAFALRRKLMRVMGRMRPADVGRRSGKVKTENARSSGCRSRPVSFQPGGFRMMNGGAIADDSL
jgi:hypothetical protein